jgi:PKD repeat protein
MKRKLFLITAISISLVMLGLSSGFCADWLPKTSWQLLYVDSQELSGENGAATNAFDGNQNTIWHTQYIPTSPSTPHEIQIDLGQTYSIQGCRYWPRQDGGVNGRIGQYEIYLSTDGINWGTAVAAGTFANTSAAKEVDWSAQNGRYIRLRALREVNGNPWTSMAELDVLADPIPGNQPPDGIIGTPTGNVTINAGGQVTFTGTGSDPDGNLPLSYHWSFGSGSGIADSTLQNPGVVQFNNPGTYTVTFTVTDALGLADPSPATRVITVLSSTIPRSGWSVRYVDSQELSGENGAASNVFDGNNATIWHTQYIPTSAPVPHEIQINLGQAYSIQGFRYLPRQDGSPNGRIGQYEFYVSMDGTSWGSAVAMGTFANDASEKQVTFAAQTGQYIRLRALTEVNGNPWTSMAELNVMGSLYTGGNLAPNGVINTPTGNVTINAGGSVTFTGTGTDPDGNLPLTYRWSFGSGSGIADSTLQNPGSVQFNNPGTYTVTFTVTDALGLADPTPATCVITVSSSTGNQAPDGVINTPTGNVTINAGDSVNFTGTGSDPDGNLPLSYHWSFGSGSGIADSTLQNPGAVQFNNPGTYTVTFTVTDALGAADPSPATRVITVNSSTGNQSPDAVIDTPTGNVTINAGGQVTFTGTGSDPDGNLPLSYHWSFGSGSGIADSTLQNPGAVQFNTPGTYSVTFTVTDALGAVDTSPATRVITVLSSTISRSGWSVRYVDSQELSGENGAASNVFDGNNATIWHTQYIPTSAPVPHEIQINLGQAYSIQGFRYLPRQDGSPNGRIGQYEFYVSMDGTSWGSAVAMGTFANDASEKQVTFAAQTGQYIRLRALTEVNGNPWTSMAELNVMGSLYTGGNLAPNGVINTPTGNVTINAGGSVTFTGTGTDPDGNLPLTYRWSFGSGSGIADSTLQNPGSVQFNNPGTYTVTFTVTDALGLADPTPATCVITVSSSTGNQAPDGVINTPTGNVTINAGGSVNFTGTGSDPDGNLPLSYHWSFGTGSGIADLTLQNPGAVQFNTPGTYTVTFTVTDALGLADPSPATRVITVNSSTGNNVTPDWTAVSQSPFTLFDPQGVVNPVLTAQSVTDLDATYVADPFLFNNSGAWYLFFEAFSPTVGGQIGVATSSDGLHWTYDRIVLKESFHLSYPSVLRYNGRYFMIPETYMANSVRVYEAANFPYDWHYSATLASGRAFVDPQVFFYNNTWWMFVSDTNDSNCYLYYSDDLLSGWVEHPMSPIVQGDRSRARGAGRSFVFDGNKVIRVAQKNDRIYGEAVRAFQVDTLTRTSYSEHEIVESPILGPSGSGWNSTGMHQFDPWWTGSQWIASMDGWNGSAWSIGIRVSTAPVTPGVIPHTGWSLLYADSQELNGENGSAMNAFDSNSLSMWHTQYIPSSAPLPHEIQIDLGQVRSIQGFRYLPRQDGEPNGRIGQYEFYVSMDGINWGSPVATGTFANNAYEKEVDWALQSGRYIRLRALTEVNGNPWTSVAEINVLGN